MDTRKLTKEEVITAFRRMRQRQIDRLEQYQCEFRAFAEQLHFASRFPNSQRDSATILAKEYFDILSNDDTGKALLAKGGLCVSADNSKDGILVTGITPSGSGHIHFCYSFKEALKDAKSGYWRNKYKEFVEGHEELLPLLSYIDLFPLHEGCQTTFMQSIKDNLVLQAKIIAVTHREIERLHPRLIIHANAQTAYYWGLSPKSTWMGYDLQLVCRDELPHSISDLYGRVYRISGDTGFRTASDRINRDVYGKSALIGSIFVRHGLYDRPNHASFRLTSGKVKVLYELSGMLCL